MLGLYVLVGVNLFDYNLKFILPNKIYERTKASNSLKIRASMHFEMFAYCMIDSMYGINI